MVFAIVCKKTSQELRMLSSVTLYCQVTKIVMNSQSQSLGLSLLLFLSFSLSLYLSLSLSFFGQFMSLHQSDQMSQRSQVTRVALFLSSSKVLSQ